MKILELENEPLSKLRGMAKSLNIPNSNRLKKESLAMMIREAEAQKEGIELRGGILEIMSEGIGFLRAPNYRISDQDVYVSQAQLRRHDLRAGDLVIGQVRPPRESERHYGLLKVESINGMDPEEATRRPVFETLTPIFPDKRFDLETDHDTLAPTIDQPDRTDWTGTKRTDRFTTQGGENHHPEADCELHFHQISRCALISRPDRRTP